MRKAMFEHEIKILKDTFARLLRRNTDTKHVNHIRNTHSADLSIVFRYVNDEDKEQVFSIIV